MSPLISLYIELEMGNENVVSFIVSVTCRALHRVLPQP